MAYGCHEERYPLPIDAVDTHRPNPKKSGATATASVSGEGSEKVKEDTARDYFGKAAPAPVPVPQGPHAPAAEKIDKAAEIASQAGGGVDAGDVKLALEEGLEKGDLTTK